MSDPKKETDTNPSAANEPYPTGNPPDPMEEYYKAHPERKLEAERAAEAEKAEKSAKTEKTEKKPAPEPEEKSETENVRGRK